VNLRAALAVFAGQIASIERGPNFNARQRRELSSVSSVAAALSSVPAEDKKPAPLLAFQRSGRFVLSVLSQKRVIPKNSGRWPGPLPELLRLVTLAGPAARAAAPGDAGQVVPELLRLMVVGLVPA
jgi:hypothetical protein